MTRPESPLDRYLARLEQSPQLFQRSTGDGIQILTDPAEIRAAEAAQAFRLAEQGRAADESQVGVMYEDQYICVLRDAVRFPDGTLGTYIRVLASRSDHAGVATVPVVAGNIVLVRHFRHATGCWHWELPRGFASSDDPESTAASELAEEIGATIVRLQPLGTVYPDSGLLASGVHLYWAEVQLNGQATDAREAIAEIRAVSPGELNAMLADGQINDGFTLSALALAKAKGFLT